MFCADQCCSLGRCRLNQSQRHRSAGPRLAVEALILKLQLGVPGPAHAFGLWRKFIFEGRAARSVELSPNPVTTPDRTVVRRLELGSEAKAQADAA